MADNKLYISQIQDNGSVLISEDVFSTVITHAIQEVEGVVSISVNPVADIVELIGKKNWGKGIKITTDDSDALCINCNVVLRYGQNVMECAKAVQDSVTCAVESMTGTKVSSVNVNVCGIER